MIKFYYTPRPTRRRSRCSSKSPACRTSRSRRHAQGRPAHAGIPCDQSERQGAGHRRWRRHRLRQQRHPALSRREDRQFLPGKPPRRAASLLSWLMFVASGVGPYSGQAVHFTQLRAGEAHYAIKRYVFEAQRHYGILDERLAKQLHAGRHLHHRRHGGVGLGAAGALRARRRGVGEFPEPEAPGRRDQCASRRCARARAEGKYTFKTEMDDEAQARHISSTCRKRWLKAATQRALA